MPAVLAAGGRQEMCVSENVRGYTRAVVQYHKDDCLTGHHVAFQVPEAREQYADFLDAVLNGHSPVVGDASCRLNISQSLNPSYEQVILPKGVLKERLVYDNHLKDFCRTSKAAWRI